LGRNRTAHHEDQASRLDSRHGRTVEEALEIAADVARRLLDSYREHGDPVPSKLRTLGLDSRSMFR
jgi:hypothetical protein